MGEVNYALRGHSPMVLGSLGEAAGAEHASTRECVTPSGHHALVGRHTSWPPASSP